MSQPRLSIEKQLTLTNLWPVLHAYGCELRLVRTPGNHTFFWLNGATENPDVMEAWRKASQDQAQLDSVAFTFGKFTLNKTPSGREYLSAEYNRQTRPLSFKEYLPQTEVKQVSLYEIVKGRREFENKASELGLTFERRFVDVVEQTGSYREQIVERRDTVAAELNAAEEVGVSPEGYTIMEGINGRYYVDSAGNVINENDVEDRVDFLRVGENFEDRVRAASGLVALISRDNRRLTRSHLEQFVESALNLEVTPENLQLAQDLVEVAAVRALSEREGPARDTFDFAVKLFQSQPVQNTRREVQDAYSYRIPVPFSVVVARLLASEAELQGETVFIPAAGNGALAVAIPSSARIHAADINDHLIEPLIETVKGRGFVDFEVEHADATKAAFPHTKFSVANPPREHRAEMLIEDVSTTRIDYQVMLRSLEARQPDGRSVFILGGDETSGRISDASRELLAYVYAHYDVEDIAEVSGSLLESHMGGANARIMIIGERFDEPRDSVGMVPTVLPVHMTYQELWAWSEAILELRAIEERQRQSQQDLLTNSALSIESNEQFEEVIEAGQDQLSEIAADAAGKTSEEPANQSVDRGERAEHEGEVTVFQSPYVAASRGDVSMMVPRNLERAQKEALETLIRQKGDVDEYVARAAGWSLDEMYSYLAAEQIDLVALQMFAQERDRSFLVADATGCGKGRALATMMRIQILNGGNVVFTTRDSDLFYDIVRDLNDINSLDIINPFILNGNTPVVNPKTGEVYFEATPPEELAWAIEHAALPADKNFVFATYSQVNRPAVENLAQIEEIAKRRMISVESLINDLEPREGTSLAQKKARLFPRLCQGAQFVQDEGHKAAGNSTTGDNIRRARMLAGTNVYSTASPSNTVRQIMSYIHGIIPKGFKPEYVEQAMVEGGDLVIENFIQGLAADGVYRRVEHDDINAEHRHIVDETRLERNRAYNDAVAPIFQAMMLLSGEITTMINKADLEQADDLVEAGLDTVAGRGRSNPFGSRLDTLTRVMLLGLKTEALIEQSLQSLNEGLKPFIPLDSTMDSVLRELIAKYESQQGYSPDIQVPVPDFKDYLNLTLTKIADQQVGVSEDGQPIRLIDNLNTSNVVAEIRKQIQKLPPLPIAVIDLVREGVEQGGYTMGEISRRSFAYKDGRIVRVTQPEKNLVTAAYNDSSLDGVIVTRAGSTGISMHASEHFEDKRRRDMLQISYSSDPKEMDQFRGRIRRRGQISYPRYNYIDSGLICDIRQQMMASKNNERLSASATGNRLNNINTQMTELRDLLTPSGNKIAFQLLEENPELATKLSIDINIADQNERYRAPEYSRNFISQFFHRLVVLPTKEQDYWLGKIVDAFRTYKQDLENRGLSIHAKEMPGVYNILSTVVYDFGEPFGENSVFNEPVLLSEIEGERHMNPIRADELMDLIIEGEKAVGANRAVIGDAIDFLNANRPSILGSWYNRQQVDLEEALENTRSRVYQVNSEIENLIGHLGQIKPGVAITFHDFFKDQDREAIVTAVLPPMDHMNEGEVDYKAVHRMNAWNVKFVALGDEQQRTASIQSLTENACFKIKGGLHSPQASYYLSEFDHQVAGTYKTRHHVMHGNMFRATNIAHQFKMGRAAYFTAEDNMRRSAILINKENLNPNALPVRLPKEALMDFALAAEGYKKSIWSNPTGSSIAAKRKEEAIEITVAPDGFVMEVPTGKGGEPFRKTDAFKELKEKNGWGKRRKGLAFQPEDVDKIHECFVEAGGNFYVAGIWRDWLTEWVDTQQSQTVSADVAPTENAPEVEPVDDQQEPTMVA